MKLTKLIGVLVAGAALLTTRPAASVAAQTEADIKKSWDLFTTPEVLQILTSGQGTLVGAWAEFYYYGRENYFDLELHFDKLVRAGDEWFVDLDSYFIMVGAGGQKDGQRDLHGLLMAFFSTFNSWSGSENAERVWFKYLDVAMGYGFQSHRDVGLRHELFVGVMAGFEHAWVDDTDSQNGGYLGVHAKFWHQFNSWFAIRLLGEAAVGALDDGFLADIRARLLLCVYPHRAIAIEIGPLATLYHVEDGKGPDFKYGGEDYEWVYDDPNGDISLMFRLAINLAEIVR